MIYIHYMLMIIVIHKVHICSMKSLIKYHYSSVTRTLTGHKSSIKCTDFHPYGEYITSGSMDTNVKVIYNHNTQIKLLLFTNSFLFMTSNLIILLLRFGI